MPPSKPTKLSPAARQSLSASKAKGQEVIVIDIDKENAAADDGDGGSDCDRGNEGAAAGKSILSNDNANSKDKNTSTNAGLTSDSYPSPTKSSNEQHVEMPDASHVNAIHDDSGNCSSSSDDDDTDDEGGGIVIGELTEPLNPKLELCWSCLIPLHGHCTITTTSTTADNDKDDRPTTTTTPTTLAATTTTFLYSTHTHPLLNIAVCSTCVERATAVESDVIDLELSGGDSDENDEEETDIDAVAAAAAAAESITAATNTKEMNACSWCGLEDEELAVHDDIDDIPKSDLILCDKCPRAFCVRCTILSLGGDVSAWETVRRDALLESSDEDNKEWMCCHCQPTSFLVGLQCAHELAAAGAGSSTSPKSSTMDEENDNSENGKVGEDSEGRTMDHDESIEKLLQELDYAEYCLSDATHRLDEATVEQERKKIELELIENNGTRTANHNELQARVQAEVDGYMERWMLHFDQIKDTVARLHEELDSLEVGILEGYYKCREKNYRLRNDVDDDDVVPPWKIEADIANERREEADGFSRGEFRGASGYKPRDLRVLKLEPEDLNAQCLSEIEDLNTIEGAIEQMQANANCGKECKFWRSKTGTTELDIEMFREKAVKFEKLSLGELVDLDKLEKKCRTDNDDAIATEKEDDEVFSRNGSGSRVVRRFAQLRALKTQARNEATKSLLAGDKIEYQPRLPPQNKTNNLPATEPKEKKRAQLQQLSVGGSSGSAFQVRLSRGMIIGDDSAEYEDSDVVLNVGDSHARVTVCHSLATLLKEHQEDGLKFCWNNICSDVLNFDQEDDGDTAIHGAILAHNMGLGKSFQAICLLHTLLTHPALIRTNGERIIRRALLVAPVNTLTNWETELQKWIGLDSGRNVPAVRFYQWLGDSRTRVHVVKEWFRLGGILCVSSEKYASTCKEFLNSSKGNTNGNKSKTMKSTPVEDDASLRKALFNPGPDIVVLDEVHSYLKSNTTIIYKVLSDLRTRLRLGLTGSPIQNNLYEYYRMASWVRPDCLGTEANFTRTFHDPIMDGMAADCTPLEAKTQEEVSSELHRILSQFVHRRDADVLSKELPFLQEAIIHVRQSKAQVKLFREFRKYQHEMDSKNFFKQYHALRPVTNHPACLITPDKSRPNSPQFDESTRVAPEKYAWICDKCQIARFRTFDEANAHEETCDGTFDVEQTFVTGNRARDNDDWWISFAERAAKSDLDIRSIEHGGKIVLLLQIIAHCDAIGDKVVVFSQSLPTLSFIEEILNSPDWGGFTFYSTNPVRKQRIGGWRRNQDYLRIDGSVDAKERGDLIDTFHDTAAGNQSRLFLISTNAGGLGINLVAANRVVLFDSHWNPAVDLQAVYRCYRYGQTKPTYCYRLLTEGSMEQKIYSRAAAKSSLSDLVIDQANPERCFTKQEMDLLRKEDTWVSCDACNKWRMLPPDLSAEEIQNLPDVWYCKDNIYDPDRSSCAAQERTLEWMLTYFERRAREIDDANAQSQDSLSSHSAKPITEVRTSFDKIHLKYTERDEVLQTLLTRSEENKSATASSGKKTWVSKWDFNFDKNDKLESTSPVEDETPIISPRKSRRSPSKTRMASPAKRLSTLPTKKNPLDSIKEKLDDSSAAMEDNTAASSSSPSDTPPRKKTPLKTNNKNIDARVPGSPYDQICKSSTGSTGKKRKDDLADRSNSGSGKKQKPHEAETSVVDLTFDSDSD